MYVVKGAPINRPFWVAADCCKLLIEKGFERLRGVNPQPLRGKINFGGQSSAHLRQ